MDSILRAHPFPLVMALPLFGSRVSAGFPSPAADYIEGYLDLNDLLVSDQVATFFLRVQGDSMRDAGIHDGNIVVVDAGVTAISGDIVVANVNGEFTLKRLRVVRGRHELHPANPDYPIIRLSEGGELQILGVVTGCVIQFARSRGV